MYLLINVIVTRNTILPIATTNVITIYSRLRFVNWKIHNAIYFTMWQKIESVLIHTLNTERELRGRNIKERMDVSFDTVTPCVLSLSIFILSFSLSLSLSFSSLSLHFSQVQEINPVQNGYFTQSE